MRVFLLLLVVAIVGALAFLQLSVKPVTHEPGVMGTDTLETPKVPQRPEDLPAFEEQMRGFMESTGEQRRRAIDEAGL